MKVEVTKNMCLNPSVGDTLEKWFPRNAETLMDNVIKGNPFDTIAKYIDVLDNFREAKNNLSDKDIKYVLSKEEKLFELLSKRLIQAKMLHNGVIQIPKGIYDVLCNKENENSIVWVWNINGITFRSRDMSKPSFFGKINSEIVVIQKSEE